MSETSPTRTLETALRDFRGALTVADAAAKSGLPLREAEQALRVLASAYAGHLAATSKGELVYSFPRGLTKPADHRLLPRVGRAIVKAASGLVRFVVRAWVSVVLVGYALVFLAVLLALTLRGSDDRDGPGEGVGILLRVIAESLFWTFHPFSPVALTYEPRWMHVSPVQHRRIPFYERVNRFVFGPTPVKTDPLAQERAVIAEIRRQKGRVVPADVMRVTGLDREGAERLLLRLVVDYAGDIVVSESGVISYTFSDLRATAAESARTPVPRAIWEERVQLPPLTGNSAGSNVLFAAINGFNLLGSGFALANGLTLERLTELLTRVALHDPNVTMTPLAAPDGIPLVLGAIPFTFSLALFALPLFRLLTRGTKERAVARQNGWRGLLRRVFGGETAQLEYSRDELARAWEVASGRAPTDAEVEGAVRDLGGTVEIRDDGALVYRFEIPTREWEEALSLRRKASDEETRAGDVVFSSEDDGASERHALPARPTPLLEAKGESLEFIEQLLHEAELRRRR